MIYFLLNLFFATGWILVNGNYSLLNFVAGFFIGFISIYLTQPFNNPHKYFRAFRASFVLVLVFLYELVISVKDVVWEVLTPHYKSNPDIVNVPLDLDNDIAITLLASMVSLIPGTIVIDVSDDKSYMVVHAMFAESEEQVISYVKNKIEKRILEIIR